MIVNEHVYSFHIILPDLADFHSETHKVDVAASPMNRPGG